MSDKVSKGVETLRAQGHTADSLMVGEKRWWLIDSRILVTPEEIEHIADGVYCLEELELVVMRRSRMEEIKCE